MLLKLSSTHEARLSEQCDDVEQVNLVVHPPVSLLMSLVDLLFLLVPIGSSSTATAILDKQVGQRVAVVKVHARSAF